MQLGATIPVADTGTGPYGMYDHKAIADHLAAIARFKAVVADLL